VRHLKFGLFYQLPCAPDQSAADRYRETLEQIILADQLGFDTAWLAELHFFQPFSIMPAPLQLAVAAAQRTNRIRFGTGVVLLPFHHPLRIVEEAGSADILTGGRLELGVGRGTIAVHFRGYNVPRDESRERFEESLAIIRQAWASERFSYQGRFFQIPEVAVAPRPIQQPHPPIRIAANSPDTAEFAGLNNYPVLVASPINPTPGFFDHVRKYRDGLARGGHDSDKGDVAALFFTCTADNLEAARAEYEPSMMHYFRTIGDQALLGDQSQYEGSYQYLRQVRERALSMTWETVASSMAMFGPAAQCLERIGEVYERARISQLVCWFNPGGRIPHRAVMAAMERFATRVMPEARRLA
jgi:alkanesulfonate monooxygenase SsuD/methylene tetrahydromethanopterin reductase-like flavin-dependent oxidoreductase (luciferase family)